MEVGVTERGFEILEFKDHNDKDCSLQMSSLAIYEQPGTSAIWFGRDDERMHLEYDLVKELHTHLSNWLEHGSFDDEKV